MIIAILNSLYCRFLAISFALYNEETVCWVLLNNSSYVLATFTFECTMSNIWCICSSNNVLVLSSLIVLYLVPDAIVFQLWNQSKMESVSWAF